MTTDSKAVSNAGSITALFVSVLLVVLAAFFLFYLSGLAASSPGAFAVSELEPGNTTVDENGTVDLSATVTNTGETAETQVVTLSFGDHETRRWLTLEPGENGTVRLTDIAADSVSIGETAYVARTEDDEATGTVTVESDRPSVLEVTALQPGDVADADSIDVSAEVTNTGGATATRTVTLRVAGETVATQSLELDPGESTTFRAHNVGIDWLDPGESTYGVYTEDDSASATVSVTAPAALAFGNATLYTANGTQYDPDTDAFRSDERFRVDVPVTNTGERATTETIELVVNETTLATETVSMAGGANRVVTFDDVETATPGVGEHGYRLTSGDAVTGGTLLIEGDDPARFDVTGLEPRNETVGQHGSFTVSATVTNTGERTGNQNVTLERDGDVRVRTSLELTPGESDEFTVYNVSVVGLSPGPHEYSVVTGDDNETMTLEVEW